MGAPLLHAGGDETTDLDHPALDAEEPLAPGTLINGRYELVEALGRGGMGVVYRVIDQLNPERVVALKTIRGQATQLDRVQMFKAEFQAMAQLRHPNVARVYDFEPIQGSPDFFFTMEYVEGHGIRSATQGRGWREILDLVVQVCRALAYVHSRGVVHRDLKPANVYVSPEGQVKVLDFGLAGMRACTDTTHVLGTPAYMAPESIDPIMVDHRSDLYSLGILTYQLLSRDLPFTAADQAGLLYRHRHQPLEFHGEAWASVPGWTTKILERLCAKEPSQRYRTANAVIEAINRAGGLRYELETQETRESYVLSSRFVGREAEYLALTGFVSRRVAGEGTEEGPIRLVCGPSGIGKSRVLREVRHFVQLEGVSFVESSCYEGAPDEYGPVAHALGYVLRLAEAHGAEASIRAHGAELAKVDPGVRFRHRMRPSPRLDSAEAEQARLFEHIGAFLMEVTEHCPLVVYLNDLQWARPGTASFVAHLAGEVLAAEAEGRKVRLAVFGSYRDDEVAGRPIEQMLARLDTIGALRVHTLASLDRPRVGVLLASVLGLEQLPEAFVDRVFSETGGNPYFVQEVMRSLIENGSVYIEDGRWAAHVEVGELDIPPGVRAAFERRAEQLTAGEREVLVTLAACARPVSSRVLAETLGLEGERLHGRLAHLVQRQMVVQLPLDEPLYQVSHDRMREAVYEGLTPDSRLALHHRIGMAVESTYGEDPGAYLYQLAYHFGLSSDRDKAYSYNVQAGERARQSYENEIGIECLTRALELRPAGLAPTSPTVLEMREKLGDMHYLVGRYDEAEGSFREALPSASGALARVRIHTKLAKVQHSRGRPIEAIELAWQGLEILGERRSTSRAGLLLSLAVAALGHLRSRFAPWTLRHARRPEQIERFEQLAEGYGILLLCNWSVDALVYVLCTMRAERAALRLPERPFLSLITSGLGLLYGTLGAERTARTFFERARQIATRCGATYELSLADCLEGLSCFFAADWSNADRLSQQARLGLKRVGDLTFLSIAYVNLFFVAFYRGRLEQAQAVAQEGYEIMARSGAMIYGVLLLSDIHWARALRGDFEGAFEEIGRALAWSEENRDDLKVCANLLRLGDARRVAGEIDASIDCLERARAIRERRRLQVDYVLYLYPLLARAYLDKLDASGPTLPSAEYHRIERELRRMVRVGIRVSRRHPNYRAPSLLARARLSWRQGRQVAARRDFAQSLAVAEAQGAWLWEADARYESSRCELHEGQVAVSGVRDQLEQALSLYDACGAVPMASRARSLLQDLRVEEPFAPAPAGAGGYQQRPDDLPTVDQDTPTE